MITTWSSGACGNERAIGNVQVCVHAIGFAGYSVDV